MSQPSQFTKLSEAVAETGFVVRGGFHAQADDGLPVNVLSVVLVGNVGEGGFASLRASPEWGTVADPLDRYTERVMRGVARRVGATVVFPQQGPPWWPFQRWAMRAEGVSVSPLQILMHPQHGLWHAYRAALMFDTRVAGLPAAQTTVQDPARSSARASGESHCARCRARPCLSACPVDAFDEHGFDRARCAQHLRSPAGRACLDEGCAARNACPVARQVRYSSAQRQFHMRAFFAALPVSSPAPRS